MCQGHNCPVREKCYRHTAIARYPQSYFVEAPIRIENGKMKCDYYWGDNDPFAELNQFTSNEKDN